MFSSGLDLSIESLALRADECCRLQSFEKEQLFSNLAQSESISRAIPDLLHGGRSSISYAKA